MELITVILLLIAIWVFYKIYQSYVDIINELKQIREKCVREGLTTEDGLVDHISENYTNKSVREARDSVISALEFALSKAS